MRNQKIILKIDNYINSILEYTSGMNYTSFKDNNMMVEACIFNLSQIGELVTKFDDEFLNRHNDIPWIRIRGLRNRIVHDYEGINLNLIWEIINSDLELLQKQLRSLIN